MDNQSNHRRKNREGDADLQFPTMQHFAIKYGGLPLIWVARAARHAGGFLVQVKALMAMSLVYPN